MKRNYIHYRGALVAATALASLMATISMAAVVGIPGPGQQSPPPNANPLRVQLAWSQAAAKPFNAEAISLMVIVTDFNSGAAVSGLTSSDFKFKFMEYGCLNMYGADMAAFHDTGNGVYQIQLKPRPNGGCAYWQAQENHTVQVVVWDPPVVGRGGQYGITAAHIHIQ